jgi:thiamine biosynthesis lipoprotein
MNHTIGPIEKLGTQWWFEFFDVPEDRLEYIRSSIIDIMGEFESRYSRFYSDSWLSQLNQHRQFVNPDPEFIELCKIALTAYERTDGVFNVAVGHTLENRGYDAQYSFVKVNKDENAIVDLPNILDINENSITLHGEAKLDFGGFGKGFMIDILAHMLQSELGIESFVINGGGDMYATRDAQGNPIEVALRHPIEHEKQIGIAKLRYQAFAASSPHLRSWRDEQGRTQHHLVGEKDEQARSSFVITTTATWADIYATALAINPKTPIPQGVWNTILT